MVVGCAPVVVPRVPRLGGWPGPPGVCWHGAGASVCLSAVWVMSCDAMRGGAVRCGAVRCSAVRCGAVRCGARFGGAVLSLGADVASVYPPPSPRCVCVCACVRACVCACVRAYVQEKVVPKSKYEEDVYINNHTSVWGSWYDRGAHCWGYACCHQSIRNAYCTGEAGKAARAASLRDGVARAMEAPAPLSARPSDARPVTATPVDLYGEVLDLELDPRKLAAAKERVRLRWGSAGAVLSRVRERACTCEQRGGGGSRPARGASWVVVAACGLLWVDAGECMRLSGRGVRRARAWVLLVCGVSLCPPLPSPPLPPRRVPQARLAARADFDGDERKHKFNSLKASDQDVTAEDIEAYKMTKSRPDDPMANFKDDDDADASGSESGSGSDSDSSRGKGRGGKKRGSSKGGKKDKKHKKHKKRRGGDSD